MKRFIQKKVERIRLLAALLVTVCGFATANAQRSSDEISAAVLVEGSVPVRWTNDAEHPWYVPEGANYVRTPETEDDNTFTSTLTFSYSSSYPTEISMEWKRQYYYDTDMITVIVDGKQLFASHTSYWNSDYFPLVVSAGNHTVQIISESPAGGASYSSQYYAGIRKLKIWECKELESACVTDGSLPLKFKNESELDKMWVTEDGYIRSVVQKEQSNVSTLISTTFTIDKPSIFSFQFRNLCDYSDYSKTRTRIDGVGYRATSSSSWTTHSVVLYPGEHTVEFENWQSNDYVTNVTEIRNVRLEQNWYEVILNNPGELGTRLTQVLEGKPIQDLELLRITGAMNSEDWEKIQLLTGIKAIDFTETGITAIPADACRDLSGLSTVMLPETLKEIGNSAFERTNFYKVNIPASVETIGNNVWYNSALTYITFSEESKLKSIGSRAFNGTRIIEFDMPDSVEKLAATDNESYLFYNCKYLQRLHISDNVKIIPYAMAYDCTSLSDVNIPSKATAIRGNAFNNTNIKSLQLPETLTAIGDRAFANSGIEAVTIPKNVTEWGGDIFYQCASLKEVILNSHCWNMDGTFAYCNALERVVLPCATPPTINNDRYNDPFYDVAKSNVILVVPDFAFDTYRSHSYWYGFTNTVKGDEASINDYWAIRGTLNLNNTLVMQGKPSVEMVTGGKLTFDANSAQTFNEFTYNTSESSPAVVLSQSNTVKADRLVSKFNVATANRWYFFSPVTDVNMADVTYPSSDSWVIRYYDGARRASENATSGNWVNVPADGTLKAGQGYIIQARAAGWLYLPAASAVENDKFFGANAVTFELEDNACETEANAGWNFVANPYPTYYDIYYIDMQAPITVWDGSTYRAYSLNDGDRGDDTFVLRPMQPFFVQKNAADLSTGMPLVGRQINTTIDRSRAPRPVIVDEHRHKLNLELFCNDNETADDYARVVLNEAASIAYETVRDASKFMSMNTEVAQLYTLGADGHPMSINERPYEDGNVALGVLLPAADRTYRISACRADRKAWLYDAETGIEQDLTEGDYIFSASKTGVDNKRFSIRFAPASSTAAEGIEATAVKVTGNTGSISVIAPADATVAVYGTDGSIITDTTATDGQLEIEVAGGVYVVKVNGESFKTIVR